MGKIIEFPGGDPKKKDQQVQEFKTGGHRPETSIDKLERIYVAYENSGRTCNINWRLYIEFMKLLTSISQSTQRQLRTMALTNPEQMSGDEVVRLFNNSNRVQWQSKPAFWIAINWQIIDRKLMKWSE